MKKPKLLLYGIDGGQSTYLLEMVNKGKLPGFARMMKEGVYFSDMMSTFPTISPTCWASIYTGAVPKVHSAVCSNLHYKTAHPGEIHSSYKSENITAERFWETAGKQGIRCLVIDTLGAGHVKAPNVTHIRGGVGDKPSKIPAFSCSLSYPENIPAYIAENTVDKHIGIDVEKEKNVFILKHKHDGKVVIEDFTWTFIITDSGIQIGSNMGTAQAAIPTTVHNWTDVMSRSIMTVEGFPVKFHFRAYVLEHDKENRIYKIVFTGACNLMNEVYPSDYAKIFTEFPEITDMIGSTPKTFDDSLGFYNRWKTMVIEWAMENENYDIIVVYSDSLDVVNHTYSGFKEGTWYSPTITKEIAEQYYENLYNVEGNMVEWLMDHAVGEDTQFCVCSDHGGIGCPEGYMTIYALADAGLLVFDEETDKQRTFENYFDFQRLHNNNPGIIWEKTKAYPTGCCYVNVNLKGREPTGSVPTEQFDDTVAEIIRALHKYDPDPDGPYSIAFAVSGEQAGFFGLGGDLCGDVVFGLAGSRVGGCYGGVHAHQIPSARVKTGGDMRPFCIFMGSKFKKNVILDRPADLTDIAPTLCFAAGMPQPKDATGGVMFAAFADEY